MSVLRAILGRFARFLVRIARRLDPGLVTASDLLVTERMAALKARYPGAPRHWLDLVARHAATAGEVEPPAQSAEAPAQPVTEKNRAEAAQPANRPRLALIKGGSAAPRPKTLFGYLGRRPRVAAAAASPVVDVVPEQPIRKPPRVVQRRARPIVTFATARARSRMPNFLRMEQRRSGKPLLSFVTGKTPQPTGSDQEPQASQPEPVPREHRAAFPHLYTQESARPERIAAPESRSRPVETNAEARWPAVHHSVPRAHLWLDQGRSSGPRNASFHLSENRWPELPAQSDQSSEPLLSGRDEATLLAEQIGGTWSA